jgi:hypothetical protein
MSPPSTFRRSIAPPEAQAPSPTAPRTVSNGAGTQALRPHRTNPPLGVGIRPWRSRWNLQHVNTRTSEHGVEAGRKLGVPITDQKPELPSPLPQIHQQIARLLGDPRARRVCSDPGQLHAAPIHLDEEQHVEPGQANRLHGEEVGRHCACRLSAQEFHPTGPATARCRPQTMTPQNRPHRCRRDDHPELARLAHDPQIAPARVLPGQTHDQIDRRLRQPSPVPPARRVDPTAGDQLPVPAQQRRWSHQKRPPSIPGQQSC